MEYVNLAAAVFVGAYTAWVYFETLGEQQQMKKESGNWKKPLTHY